MSEPTPATTSTAATTTSETAAGTQLLATQSKTVKPGWKTTEFWLSLAAKFVGFLLTAGILADGSPQMRALGVAAMVLSSLGYTVARGLAKSGAALILLIGLASLTTSPACSGSAREARLRDAVTGLNVAKEAFRAFDHEHKAKILASSTTEAEFAAKFEAYKTTRARVLDLFAAAYNLIASAAVLNKDDTSLVNAILAAQLALSAWAELKGVAP